MHPTIPVHAPLTFTLIDRFNGRSLGQCVYRVAPPPGSEYSGRPASAAEALARRLERFEVINSIEPVITPEEEMNPIFPGTLDLRIPTPAHSAGVVTPGPSR